MHRYIALLILLALPAILFSAPPARQPAPETPASASSQPAPADPAPISLELKDATFAEMLTALTKATGVPIRFGEFPAQLASARYTLSAKNRPFWEVFTALSRQGKWDIASVENEVGIARTGQSLTDYQVAGPFLIYVETVNYDSGHDFRLPPDRAEEHPGTYLVLRIIADPRLHVTAMKPVEFTTLLDANEHNLIQPIAPDRISGRPHSVPTFSDVFGHNFAANCNVPPTTDKKITLLRATVNFKIAITASSDVPGFPKADPKGVDVGPVHFLFQTPEVQGKQSALNFDARPDGAAKVWITIFSADDVPLVRRRLEAGNAGERLPGANLPSRFHVEWAIGTREVTVPIELLNIPLPK